jgi:hypothetical protein
MSKSEHPPFEGGLVPEAGDREVADQGDATRQARRTLRTTGMRSSSSSRLSGRFLQDRLGTVTGGDARQRAALVV